MVVSKSKEFLFKALTIIGLVEEPNWEHKWNSSKIYNTYKEPIHSMRGLSQDNKWEVNSTLYRYTVLQIIQKKSTHEAKLERHSGTNGSALKRRFHSCWLEPAQVTSSGFTCILAPLFHRENHPTPKSQRDSSKKSETSRRYPRTRNTGRPHISPQGVGSTIQSPSPGGAYQQRKKQRKRTQKQRKQTQTGEK